MNLSKDVKYAVTAFLVFVCEAVFGKYITIFGATPMLMLCYFVLLASFEKDFSYVVTLSLVFGIVTDMGNSHGFFSYLIMYPISAYITYKFCDSVFSSKRLFIFLDVFLLTIIGNLFYCLTHTSDMENFKFWICLIKIILPSAIYNSVICILFYPLCKKIFKR